MFAKKKYLSKKLLIFPCILLLAAIIACTFDVGIVETTQTPKIETDDNLSGHDLAANSEAEEQEAVAKSSPINSDAECQESRHTGFVFAVWDQNHNSLWQIGSCGEHYQLLDQSYAWLSPEGDQALYIKDNDIWIVNLLSGKQRNLTNTPDRIEVNPQWWPGKDLVIFGSRGEADELGPTAGYLSTVSTDGSDYRILVDQPSNATPAPQPGGSMIAYDFGNTAWLYNLDLGGSELFDVGAYGLNILKGMRIGSPSWSPDGKKLTWWVGGVFEPSIDGAVALAVFDLEGRSAELRHPYSPIGTGGWLPAPIWSPDGNWVAVNTLSEAHKTDLWVINAKSGEEHLLGFASNPVWHPNGVGLIYQALPDGGIKMMEISGWRLESPDLPAGSVPVDWLETIINSPGADRPSITDTEPSFGPEVIFAPDPDPAKSLLVFPYTTPEIFAIWSYRNMREGLTIRREWYQDGAIWIVREEPWDYAKYGRDGIVTDISVYDFDQGLEPGRYQLRLYIDNQEQRLGVGEGFSSAFFTISAPIEISPQVSPDFSQLAIVKPPGTLIIQDVETQEQRTLLTKQEISSLAWYPDGKYILFSVRDRSGKQAISEPLSFVEKLWVVNLETGEAYPLQDQFGQDTGTGLHHPYISPDGKYVAVIEGTGWGDACYVDSQLWVKEIAFSGDHLYEVYSYFQQNFAITPAPENGEMYIKRIIGWESTKLLKVELRWTCTSKYPDGIYMIDMSTLTAQKLEN